MYKNTFKRACWGLLLNILFLRESTLSAVVSWRVMTEKTSGHTVIIIGDLHKEIKVFETHVQELITWLEAMKGRTQCFVELPEVAHVSDYHPKNFRGSTWKIAASYMKDQLTQGNNPVFKPLCPASRAMVNLISISHLIEEFKQRSKEITNSGLKQYLNERLPSAGRVYISSMAYTLIVKEFTDAASRIEAWQKELALVSKTAAAVLETKKKTLLSVALPLWQGIGKVYGADRDILLLLTSAIPIQSTTQVIHCMLQSMIVMPIYSYVEAAFFYAILQDHSKNGARTTAVMVGETHAQSLERMLFNSGYVLDTDKSWSLDSLSYTAMVNNEISDEEIATIIKGSIPDSLSRSIGCGGLNDKKDGKENKRAQSTREHSRLVQCGNLLCKTGSTTLQRCSRCKKVVYCSSACQKSDWKLHKKICS